MACKMQTAIIQSESGGEECLPLSICPSTPIPTPLLPRHVLVRVKAVALNPNDYKMAMHFPKPGNGAGCDFSGVVESPGNEEFQPGTRVCGTMFPYPHNDNSLGAFAQFVAADTNLLIRVPASWSDVQAAAMGGVGWSTVALAMASPQALALTGRPSQPQLQRAETSPPVLVYGGGTATGTMACQLLKLSGYMPITVTNSTASGDLALQYGAAANVLFTNHSSCVQEVRRLARAPIRYALDCITDADSAAVCFGAITRTGGRYACLEFFQPNWSTRQVIKVKEVMGYEVLGRDVDFGPSIYTRERNPEAFDLGQGWKIEVQRLMEQGLIRSHPVEELQGQWEGILKGLEKLRSGKVRGRKLVIQIS